jgi:hypothetical protein
MPKRRSPRRHTVHTRDPRYIVGEYKRGKANDIHARLVKQNLLDEEINAFEKAFKDTVKERNDIRQTLETMEKVKAETKGTTPHSDFRSMYNQLKKREAELSKFLNDAWNVWLVHKVKSVPKTRKRKHKFKSQYIFYQDSGHGWIAVPLADVKALGMKVSDYSYFRGKTVYLEEDYDASNFMKAFEKATGVKPIIREKYRDGRSPIRSYRQAIPQEIRE